ncbi:hypothetical protein [Komagataeibacter xylinus]|uniref:hypothetical protein n=1 Tax=Komagataeibacter xylinus TaxID=28448 RepID=UPI00280C3E22|nr:hypothetical protein [Komagataeibacter xylinus]
MSKTIIAKSDQLNADDLLGGPRTVEIERVTEGNADQPVAVLYKGCNGKPYYPCKSMRRVMVHVWGSDGHSYAGKAMTLFREPNVKFGGIMVGGIRISHMSGLQKDMPIALQVTRGSKKLYTVKPLQATQTEKSQSKAAPAENETKQVVDGLAEQVRSAQEAAERAINAMNAASDMKALERINMSNRYKELIEFVEKHDKATFSALTKCATDNAQRISEAEFA